MSTYILMKGHVDEDDAVMECLGKLKWRHEAEKYLEALAATYANQIGEDVEGKGCYLAVGTSDERVIYEVFEV